MDWKKRQLFSKTNIYAHGLFSIHAQSWSLCTQLAVCTQYGEPNLFLSMHMYSHFLGQVIYNRSGVDII